MALCFPRCFTVNGVGLHHPGVPLLLIQVILCCFRGLNITHWGGSAFPRCFSVIIWVALYHLRYITSSYLCGFVSFYMLHCCSVGGFCVISGINITLLLTEGLCTIFGVLRQLTVLLHIILNVHFHNWLCVIQAILLIFVGVFPCHLSVLLFPSGVTLHHFKCLSTAHKHGSAWF